MPRSRRQLAKIQESIQKERSVVLKAALSGNFKLFRRGIAEELDSLQEIPVGEVCLGEGLLEVRVTDDEANRLVRKAYAELLDATEGPLGSRTRRGTETPV